MQAILSSKLTRFNELFPNEIVNTINHLQGAEHHVLEINNEWICKISKNTDSRALEVEKNILTLLDGNLKTRIPVVTYYEPNLLIYKKILGVELTNDLYNDLNPHEKASLAHDIAFFLYELHNCALQDAKKLGLSNTDWPWEPEKLKTESYLIDDPELKEIFETFIKEYEQLPSRKTATLIHNDMISRNIIVHNKTGKLEGVIDFTDVAIDDPYLDLRLNYLSVSALSISIANAYATLAKITINISAIYIYYIATEFSRYLQTKKDLENSNQIVKTPVEIIKNRIKNATAEQHNQ